MLVVIFKQFTAYQLLIFSGVRYVFNL